MNYNGDPIYLPSSYLKNFQDSILYIPKNKSYGMDDVVRKAISKKKLVSSFTTKKGFMDIGDKTSYKKAYQQFLEKLGNI